MLKIFRATNGDQLAAALANVLHQPLSDPFAAEIIAVPARGVERWLNQRIASAVGGRLGGQGIAANIDYLSTAQLVDDAIAAASGVDARADPWSGRRLVWAVLSAIDESLGEPWCAVLRRYLGGGSTGVRAGRRYATAAHLAELFTSYGAQRAELFSTWARGRAEDGSGAPLDLDLRWQFELWRKVRQELGPSPAERLKSACTRMATDVSVLDLPSRISVFGPTRLDDRQLLVLQAISEQRDVHLWLPHPSPAMWHTLADSSATHRSDDESALSLRHPLLISLAHSVREMQLRLNGVSTESRVAAVSTTASQSLLAVLQADLAADRPPSQVPAADDSVQIYSCHGPTRQVEVLREALLHAFESDPTLQPRDVVVMCPDIETYAPLIRAAFGQVDGQHPGHKLRVRLADRALHQSNPVLGVLAQLLDLAGGRSTASEVLSLIEAEPVWRKFGFSPDDLEKLRRWTATTGARWGIGARERQVHGLADFANNTFQGALDRLMLGITADESGGGWMGPASPHSVEAAEADLAGRFAEFIDRLEDTLGLLSQVRGADEWSLCLIAAVAALCATDPTQQWQLTQAQSEIAAAFDGAGGSTLRLADVRAQFRRALAGRPTRSNFRTGELTVCTMVPMRSVPHRVIALIGLDDNAFPRSPGVDGDDLLARNPCVGDRDLRSEDRQLLLDAVCAARDKLLLFYSGADPVSGKPRPPAVPLGELVDVLESMVASAERLVRREPLQIFDARNFDPAGPFSFDVEALAGARAHLEPQQRRPPLLAAPMSPGEIRDIELPDLVAFVEQPVRAFLRQRLGLRLEDWAVDIADVIPIELDGLQRWDIGNRVLQARLGGSTRVQSWELERRRGGLPPGQLGGAIESAISSQVEAILTQIAAYQSGSTDTAMVNVDLGDGSRLVGSVAGVRDRTILVASYSSVGAKQRIAAFVRVLALAATHGGQWRAVTVGRDRARAVVREAVTPDDSAEVLRGLVRLMRYAQQTPLPLLPASIEPIAQSHRRGVTDETALRSGARAWFSKSKTFGEPPYGDSQDPAVQYVFGDAPEFTTVAVTQSRAVFWAAVERLWNPVFDAERRARS